jgi:hypothetical protein
MPYKYTVSGNAAKGVAGQGWPRLPASLRERR